MVDTHRLLKGFIMPNELIGQGDVVKGYYSQAERMAQVLRFLSDGKIRSTSEIARALKMRPSSNFRKMLTRMWTRKLLLAYTESGMYRWQFPPLTQIEMFPENEEM